MSYHAPNKVITHDERCIGGASREKVFERFSS
jgi:hypothetical protein